MAVLVPDAPAATLNERQVLLKAWQRAGEELGLSAQDIDQAIGNDKKVQRWGSMDPHMRQTIALVLRLHRNLSALVGHDIALMQHWMATANHHTGGVPRQQLQDPAQLVKLVQYLDAMRRRP